MNGLGDLMTKHIGGKTETLLPSLFSPPVSLCLVSKFRGENCYLQWMSIRLGTTWGKASRTLGPDGMHLRELAGDMLRLLQLSLKLRCSRKLSNKWQKEDAMSNVQ